MKYYFQIKFAYINIYIFLIFVLIYFFFVIYKYRLCKVKYFVTGLYREIIFIEVQIKLSIVTYSKINLPGLASYIFSV